MQTPGNIDPVSVARQTESRPDGRIDLTGLGKVELRATLEAAGLDAKAAKLRAKQIWHWIYNRGVTDFALMTDIARTVRHRAARDCRGAGVGGRHAQVAAANGGRAGFRDGLHS
jgi:adenine C2-methylase RlmN of 23S rRNA A2503 and tRNA A37